MCGGWLGEGKSGWLLGFNRDMERSYIQIFASQAADMRARLWTYVVGNAVHGPTHTHSHTALHTPSGPPVLLSTVSPHRRDHCRLNSHNGRRSLPCRQDLRPLCHSPPDHPPSPAIFIRFSTDFPAGAKHRGTMGCSESFRSQTRETRVAGG